MGDNVLVKAIYIYIYIYIYILHLKECLGLNYYA
jgi:hypothetical protein